ncbi:MAG: hypothetical protein LLF94_06450 [Chlamydiales bacterium]|nr:hypothetical protein [Chlamydiales bacterium]
MCKHPKRRSFVLIEVIVATSLFVMLLIVVFGIFASTTKTNAALSRLRQANEQLLVTQAKLQDYFSRVMFKKAIDPYFYQEIDRRSGLPSLIFTIKAATQKIPELNGYPIIKLYVEDNQLIAATFPHSNLDSSLSIMQKEALLSNVTDFKAQFFLAPESQKEPKKDDVEEEETEKKAPTGTWTDTWLMEYDKAPTLIKLEITRKSSESCTLWFFITPMIQTVLYDMA